jgi:hypothetical protein
MRTALIWLVIAGVWSGTLAVLLPHMSEGTDACQLAVDCDIGEAYPCEISVAHDRTCEVDKDACANSMTHHHHVHVCHGVAPILYVESDTSFESISLSETRMRVLMENIAEPESPVFELDKPPLI